MAAISWTVYEQACIIIFLQHIDFLLPQFRFFTVVFTFAGEKRLSFYLFLLVIFIHKITRKNCEEIFMKFFV